MAKWQELFIGYETMEEWRLAAVKDDEPVLVTVARDVTGDRYGLKTEMVAVEAAQADGENRVHYCRIYVGQAQTVDGTPMGQNDAMVLERANMALDATKAWLKDGGCSDVRMGRVAMPMTIRALTGRALFLRDW